MQGGECASAKLLGWAELGWIGEAGLDKQASSDGGVGRAWASAAAQRKAPRPGPTPAY